MKAADSRVFTVGHSNRSIAEFIEILKASKLKLLVDVRKIPKSRHNPQFGAKRLAASLKKAGIEYVYGEGFAGFRRSATESKNGAWRNKSFRAYADYMQTPEFQKHLKRLISKIKRKRLVLMCAEAVPWRCHRSLIADSLIAKGLSVTDLYSRTHQKPHKLPAFARISNEQVHYPIEALHEKTDKKESAQSSKKQSGSQKRSPQSGVAAKGTGSTSTGQRTLRQRSKPAHAEHKP